MDIGRNSAQGDEHETSETITLREIANEARERVMHERMELMEKQMEILTAILHELRNEQRRAYDANATRDDVTTEPSHRRNRNEEIHLIRETSQWGA